MLGSAKVSIVLFTRETVLDSWSTKVLHEAYYQEVYESQFKPDYNYAYNTTDLQQLMFIETQVRFYEYATEE